VNDTPIIAIPDTEGELDLWLDRLLDVLAWHDPCDSFPEDSPPDPIGDWTAQGALVGLVQDLDDANEHPVMLVAPDGRLELVPMLAVEYDPGDVAVLAEALEFLDEAGAGSLLHDEVVAPAARRAGVAVPDLVDGFRRALSLFDPDERDASEALAAAVAGCAGDRLVLDDEKYRSYVRVTGERIERFHAGDPLARFLYLG
jgi:hypothetical protein